MTFNAIDYTNLLFIDPLMLIGAMSDFFQVRMDLNNMINFILAIQNYFITRNGFYTYYYILYSEREQKH